MTNPAEKLANMNVNMTGIQSKIIFCVGSGGVGFSFIWNHIVMPMMIGQTPRCRKCPTTGSSNGSYGMRPNKLKMLVGSGAERSWIQPKNGACRISMVTNSTLYSEKNTGICKATGRQPAIGLIFSFL